MTLNAMITHRTHWRTEHPSTLDSQDSCLPQVMTKLSEKYFKSLERAWSFVQRF